MQQADDAEGALAYQILLREEGDIYECDGQGLFYNLKRMKPKDAKRTFSITLKPVSAATIAEQVAP